MILTDLFGIQIEKQEKDMQENRIPSKSSLWYVVNKVHEDKCMRIAGFVCKYPLRMSCNKGENTRLG